MGLNRSSVLLYLGCRSSAGWAESHSMRVCMSVKWKPSNLDTLGPENILLIEATIPGFRKDANTVLGQQRSKACPD